jgi:hypothetical protein
MDTCGIIIASIIGGAFLLGTSLACGCSYNQRWSQAQRQVAPHPDCIVITKEHYENLKRFGSCEPPAYIEQSAEQSAEHIQQPPVYTALN